MLTFNIADLHGRKDLAVLALNAIDKYVEDRVSNNIVVEPPTLVFTGDYIDRGPDSKGVLEFIIDLQDGKLYRNTAFEDIIALKGNHETFMLNAYRGIGIDFWVVYNGGAQTYKSYGWDGKGATLPKFPEEHIQWVNSLPLYYDDGKRLYVHAGVDHSKALADQEEETLVWKLYDSGPVKFSREPDGLENTEPYNIKGPNYLGDYTENISRHIVHGHHQFTDGPKLFTNRSNFDTLAWYTGRLVIGVFDSEKAGGPVDTIEVQGKTIKELIEAQMIQKIFERGNKS